MQALSTTELPQIPAEAQQYFRDVEDHLERVAEQVAGFDELLTGILNANLTQVGIQQNNDMRKISAWVAIGAVPTAIAAIYGMNFEHMPELHWMYGYPMVLGVTAVLCICCYIGVPSQRLALARGCTLSVPASALAGRQGFQVEREGVHAVALVGGAGTVVEDVAEVRPAAPAPHLNAHHAMRAVLDQLHGVGDDRLGEARPARAGVVLRGAVEQRQRRTRRSDRPRWPSRRCTCR